jgi:hypothetical protein
MLVFIEEMGMVLGGKQYVISVKVMEADNLPLVIWIKENCKAQDSPSYTLNVGSQFVIRINPIPIDIPQDSLTECEFVTIFVSQMTKDTSPGEDEFQAGNVKIFLNWSVMPEPIHPQRDERFSTQEWKDKFVENTSFFFKESSALVSLDEACDIIRFCFRLSNIKAFW